MRENLEPSLPLHPLHPLTSPIHSPPPPPKPELAVGVYDVANVGVANQVLSTATFWFVILVVNMSTFGLRFAERTFTWSFRSQDTMIMAEHEKSVASQGKVRAGAVLVRVMVGRC